ncbi:MAG: AAA family ATPase [Saprospiraceae bacterium]
MIKELSIRNFRSIREATLELGRFTVLTGANNSGKSSVLYALQVLKNVVTNPNRSVDELLNLGFLNLGGMENCVFRSDNNLTTQLGISAAANFEGYRLHTSYELTMGAKENSLGISLIEPKKESALLKVSFPYLGNKNASLGIGDWNGLTTRQLFSDSGLIEEGADLPVKSLSQTDVIPTSRGFYKPIFNTTPLNGQIYTEDEVATLLAIDKDVQSKVAYYFEKITGKRFSISIQPGMGFFYMQVREADGSFSTELVNQGMGMNQIVFLLAKILYGKNRLICIDEPEIHLHPSLIEQFVRVLVEIAEKENKQFIFSTHSEHWLLSLLAEVNDGKLAADDLKVYYLQKNDQETNVEQQQVMPNGQLEGGLKNFMESQMRLAERFFDTTTA